MMRLIGLIFRLVILVTLATFLFANDHLVAWSLWPMPLTLEVPAYLLPMATLAIGLLIGAGYMWLRHVVKSATDDPSRPKHSA